MMTDKIHLLVLRCDIIRFTVVLSWTFTVFFLLQSLLLNEHILYNSVKSLNVPLACFPIIFRFLSWVCKFKSFPFIYRKWMSLNTFPTVEENHARFNWDRTLDIFITLRLLVLQFFHVWILRNKTITICRYLLNCNGLVACVLDFRLKDSVFESR